MRRWGSNLKKLHAAPSNAPDNFVLNSGVHFNSPILSNIVSGLAVVGTNQVQTLTGGDGNDTITGGDAEDTLIGGSGNDLIYGGDSDNLICGGALLLDSNSDPTWIDPLQGDDTMYGGTGLDTYIVNSSKDVVIDSGVDVFSGAASPSFGDIIYSSISYTLPNKIEILHLVGSTALTAKGNDLENQIFGNDLGNTISGFALIDFLYGAGGNDTIYGGTEDDFLDGGTGADRMVGGSGDDTFYVDDVSDKIIEKTGEGYDWVESEVSFVLPANVEVLVLYGQNMTAKGNALNNEMYGGVSNVILYGIAGNDSLLAYEGSSTLYGGDGNDTLNGLKGSNSLYGGAGQDIISGDTGADTLDGGIGNDSLSGFSTMNGGLGYSCGNDLYYGRAGNDTISAGDNNDTIYGGTENDAISARNGSDSLFGGAGDDSLQGGDGSDTIYGDAGNDRIYAHNDNASSDSTANQLYGGTENDTLVGASGVDTLDGGYGADSLTGGGGADCFVFAKISGVDHVTDFTTTVDHIVLGTTLVTMLGGSAALTEQTFYADAGAVTGHDADDRLIYNTTTGALYYDKDGNGSKAAVQIALLDLVNGIAPTLAYDDFIFS